MVSCSARDAAASLLQCIAKRVRDAPPSLLAPLLSHALLRRVVGLLDDSSPSVQCASAAVLHALAVSDGDGPKTIVTAGCVLPLVTALKGSQLADSSRCEHWTTHHAVCADKA